MTLHPHIDILLCIGCGSCVKVCPESVLGIVQGRAAIVSGIKCVGHALCEDVCPVGAITMGFGTPKEGQEIPWYDGNYQTNVEGIYIVGELGGIGLIKECRCSSLHAMQNIAQKNSKGSKCDYDVIIVGAGPGRTHRCACGQGKRLALCRSRARIDRRHNPPLSAAKTYSYIAGRIAVVRQTQNFRNRERRTS